MATNRKAEVVELRPAHEWTCPECGRDQFERCYVPDFAEEELAELNEAIHEGSEDDYTEQYDDDMRNGGGVLVFCPSSVVCKFCERRFDSEPQTHWL